MHSEYSITDIDLLHDTVDDILRKKDVEAKFFSTELIDESGRIKNDELDIIETIPFIEVNDECDTINSPLTTKLETPQKHLKHNTFVYRAGLSFYNLYKHVKQSFHMGRFIYMKIT